MAVDLKDLVEALQEADGPSRELDREIAVAAGYVESIKPVTVEGQPTEIRKVWTHPVARTDSRLPGFTLNMTLAKDLVAILDPDAVVAFRWYPGGAMAVIEGRQIFYARTMQLALCVAAIDLKC